jgi:hypothetical protein
MDFTLDWIAAAQRAAFIVGSRFLPSHDLRRILRLLDISS